MSTLYDILTILPLSLLAVMLFGGYAGMPEGSLPGYALCLLFSLGVIVIRNMTRKNRLRSIGIIAVFLIGLLLAAGEEYRTLFLEEYLWTLRLLGIAAAALAAGMLMQRTIWIRRAVSAVLLIGCITGTILGWEIGKAVFLLICLLLLVHLAEEIQRRWKKSGYPDMKAHITSIAPVFLAGILLVYAAPAPAEPYDWQFVKDGYAFTVTQINRLYGYLTHPSEEYGTMGFSDSGGFLAGISGSDEEVLLITADHKSIKTLKLVGCLSGEFTGREWVFAAEEAETATRMTDTIETACAVRKYAPTSRSDYLQKLDLHYEILLYNTKYIFSPAKIKLETTRKNNTSITEMNGSIVSKRSLHYKDKYQVSCYVLNSGNPDLAELYRTAAPITQDEWNQTALAENVTERSGCSYAAYQQYRSDVYETYCHSYGVSEEVRAILDEISTGASGRYETLKNLEAYLQEMEYTTDCGPLPDTVTDAAGFLDYFLLDARKGYCMHYATAFTLMANELGIPCRYVQGYQAKRDVSGNFLVTQRNAHAWPEAYFDNVGWVSFEPTPGYADASGWKTARYDPFAHTPEQPVPDGETAAEDEPSDDTGEETTPLHPLVFIIPTLAVISFLLLLFLISRSAARSKYRRMDLHDKFRHLTQQNLRYLGYLGFRMEQDETLSEYADRITHSDRQDLQAHLGFILLYETVLYADRELTAEDISATEQTCRALRELVKKSKLRYRLLLLLRNQ